jgi:hypothetical protein
MMYPHSHVVEVVLFDWGTVLWSDAKAELAEGGRALIVRSTRGGHVVQRFGPEGLAWRSAEQYGIDGRCDAIFRCEA